LGGEMAGPPMHNRGGEEEEEEEEEGNVDPLVRSWFGGDSTRE
jgi:hypothetical protein